MQHPARILTDKFITSLQPADKGKRDWYPDQLVLTFGLRITDRGAKSWSICRRWPPLNQPAHLKIGAVDKLSLAGARDKARKWIELAERNIDPRQVERDAVLEIQRKAEHQFGTVAEDWLASPEVTGQRKRDEVERDVRREFIPLWGKRPITSITEAEIAKLIRAKAARSPAQARNELGYIKRLFLWALDQHVYGLDTSPADRLRANRICGKKVKRKRVLNDAELRTFWHAALATPYPYGPLFQMLALTGQREGEVGGARWREFDMAKRIWVIPASRMKMNVSHVVPVCDDLMALLNTLPKFNSGDCLFSFNNGKSAVNGYGKAKNELDALMGDSVEHFVIHDVRRTVRTDLSALPIANNVREAMIAHAAPGMSQVYDHYLYTDEKRAGFALWEKALRKIVEAKG
jgi:integrase